jgi:ribosomal protein L37E
MNHDEGDWKRQLEKSKVVQKCPRCGELSLKFTEGKIKCASCGYEENVRAINENK